MLLNIFQQPVTVFKCLESIEKPTNVQTFKTMTSAKRLQMIIKKSILRYFLEAMRMIIAIS